MFSPAIIIFKHFVDLEEIDSILEFLLNYMSWHVTPQTVSSKYPEMYLQIQFVYLFALYCFSKKIKHASHTVLLGFFYRIWFLSCWNVSCLPNLEKPC